MKWLKYTILIFVSIFVHSGMAISSSSDDDTNQQIISSGGIENYLAEMSEMINQMLPATSSKNKEMVSVSANKNIITYHFVYTVPINDEYFLSKKSEMEESWIKSMCHAPASKTLIQHGASIIHYTYTNKKVRLLELVANSSTCSNR